MPVGGSRAAHRLREESTDSPQRTGQHTTGEWTRAGGGASYDDWQDDDQTRYVAPGGYDDSSSGDSFSIDPPSSRLDDDDYRGPLAWHGGADLGLLVLRVALGGVFILRGAPTVLDVLGGDGIAGFADYLDDAGFIQATILAWGVGLSELIGGILLVIGLFTPLAASALLCVMANAILLNRADGYFLPDGVEYLAVLGAMAFVALFAGPGRVALDRGRSWFRHPLGSGFLFLVLAIGVTAVVQFVLR